MNVVAMKLLRRDFVTFGIVALTAGAGSDHILKDVMVGSQKVFRGS